MLSIPLSPRMIQNEDTGSNIFLSNLKVFRAEDTRGLLLGSRDPGV
jgi:hypothetical protein